jgi:ribokinase
MSESLTLCAGFAALDDVQHLAGDVPAADTHTDVTERRERAGGSAANTALGLAALGRDAAVLSSVGDDEAGRRLTRTLADHGVTPVMARSAATPRITAVVEPGADPRYLAHEARAPEVRVDGVDDETWARTEHVHVTTFDREGAAEVAERASADGKTVSFNPTQGYEREAFPGAVDAADLIVVNDREAEILDDRHGLDDVCEDTTVVVTHGADGATAHVPDRAAPVEHDGYDAGEVADTIGAGDAFVAGFLDAWVDDRGVEAALAQGCAAGAHAVTRVGAPDELDADRVRERAGTRSLVDDIDGRVEPPEHTGRAHVFEADEGGDEEAGRER